ncbi:MAG: hypothetical protein K2F94_01860 [Muribaculaceae bacterium]|nr:hypothetical protein [Muribaculaceae bacterium]MDE6399963.1 hypothetical protein [Muribaculaceae bacterium]MDE6532035.1 hypothetical protein [Muribaculaceae bacterium]
MKKISIVISLLVAIVFPSLGQGLNSTDSITVAGRIINVVEGKPRTIIVNECDYASDSVREITEIDSAGNFNVRIPFSFPHTFTLNYDVRNYINAFAAPGDSVFVEIDASLNPVGIRFGGDKATVSREYNSAIEDLSSIFSCNFPSFKSAADEFIASFVKHVETGRNAIDRYASEHDISDEVKRMLYTENMYALANQAMDYEGRDSVDCRKFFLNPIFDIFNEENTKVMYFPYHLSKVLMYAPEIIETAPKGIVRDLMYVRAFEESEGEMNLRREDFYLPGYYDRLFASEATCAPIKIDGIAPGDIMVCHNGKVKSIKSVNPLEWLLKEYSGYPLYLDVSATWCGPCIANLNASEGLRKHYAGSDMVFAVIWLRSSQDAWKKITPKISNAVHIFIPDNEMGDLIMKYLSVGGFPSHYMISRGGEIKGNVPNYLSNELPLFLDSHLNP